MNAVASLERTPLEALADPQEGETPGIAIYGNGYASVVALGGLDILAENGLLRNVRGYSAESGGAYDALAAERQQIPMAIELFTEVLPRDGLVSAKNILSRSPSFLNLDRLTHRLQTTHQIDIGSVTNDPEILVGMSRMLDAKRIAVRLGDVPPEKRLEVLERSASIPLASGRVMQGTCDGAVLSPSPALAAAEAGYSHILLLANSSEEAAPWTENVFHRSVARMLTRRHSGPEVDIDQVMAEYTTLFKQHSEDLRAGRIGTSVVQIVRPQKVKRLNAYCDNPNILKKGVQAGKNSMHEALGQPEMIQPLSESEQRAFAAAFVLNGFRRVAEAVGEKAAVKPSVKPMPA